MTKIFMDKDYLTWIKRHDPLEKPIPTNRRTNGGVSSINGGANISGISPVKW